MLAVADDVFVIDGVELEVVVGLQDDVFSADLVDLGDVVLEVVRLVQIPAADLVFLRVHVFFAADLYRQAVTELECGSVDAVAAGQGGGQDQPDLECGVSAHLQVVVEDVGGVGPEVGPEVFVEVGGGEGGEVVFEFFFGVAPGEVGVGLGESELGELAHELGAGKGFGEEDGVGRFFFYAPDQPFPEGEVFGVGVVDPEYGDSLFDPVDDDLSQFFPELFPSGGLEFERVDVLVFFGRIFGVLDGVVGPHPKPFGMFLDVGVVG